MTSAITMPASSRFDAETLRAPDLLIVLGGPIGVYERDAYPFIADEVAAIAARLQANKPMLGICLGAQMMAAALGAGVAPGPVKEIGWAPLTSTASGRASVLGPLGVTPVLHWHGDNCELPTGCTRLASTPHCPVQAFMRTPSQLALQFHLETEPARFEAGSSATPSNSARPASTRACCARRRTNWGRRRGNSERKCSRHGSIA